MDGENILDDFLVVIAAEIRLPEALNKNYYLHFNILGLQIVLT
jgi:hypothetical protein